MKSLKGKKARIISDNDNYSDYMDKTLVITHVAYSEKEHPGYDSGLAGEALCDFETEDGESVPFSLYEYEFKLVR